MSVKRQTVTETTTVLVCDYLGCNEEYVIKGEFDINDPQAYTVPEGQYMGAGTSLEAGWRVLWEWGPWGRDTDAPLVSCGQHSLLLSYNIKPSAGEQ